MAEVYLLFLVFSIVLNVAQSKSNVMNSYGHDDGTGQHASNKGTLHKHVYVYSAPDDDHPSLETKVIRPQYPHEKKHINIIFIKAPSQQKEVKTEVILPEEPYKKTLIYVLVKKHSEPKEYIKVKSPEPTKPPRPEVFFIRYKNQDKHTYEKPKDYEYHEENTGIESHDYYPTSDNHSYGNNGH